jgi:hypothetical protein
VPEIAALYYGTLMRGTHQRLCHCMNNYTPNGVERDPGCRNLIQNLPKVYVVMRMPKADIKARYRVITVCHVYLR